VSLVSQIELTIATHHLLCEGETIVVGVSGGPDSLCLLHLLHTRYHLVIQAAHLNHGIRGSEADDDSVFVSNLCLEWGIPCTIERIDVPALARELHLSLEEAARKARYAFLARTAHRLGATKVAVGHHADDQAETILMHLLRGAGLSGLRGMRPIGWLNEEENAAMQAEPMGTQTPQLRLVRPLLQVTRAHINAYCVANHLQPRLDRSNLDTSLYRNRLRHHLLPLLEEYNPQIRQVLLRTAEVVGADQDLLETLVSRTWPQVVETESSQAIIFNLRALRALPIALQRSILRRGMSVLKRSLRDVSYLQLDSLLNVLNKGVAGKQAVLPAGLYFTLRYEQAILSFGKVTAPTGQWLHMTLDLPIAVTLNSVIENTLDGWRLITRQIPVTTLAAYKSNDDRHAAFFSIETLNDSLSLGTRSKGDYMFPLGMDGRRQKLHDQMINAKIPQAARDGIPVLRVGKEVAWVVGLRQDQRFAVNDQTKMVLHIQFQTI
jgi:tRNA(Ile)-lysidine synthase